ncbi:MAG TPA: hypothetical protein VJS44_03005 [Pyrinomonadaceae bacterium]|nr:hypothetical protein [Pyrinomonadaceae bacterium]
MKESEAGDINGLISSESLERDNEKRLVEAELLQRSHQLRNFERFKYNLITSGEDYAAAHKRLSAEREKLAESLRALNDAVIIDTGGTFVDSHHELVAPRLGFPGEGPFVFGTEGCVALPRASDGVSVVPDRSKTFGEIRTTELGPLGSITFRSEDPTGQEIGLGVTSGFEVEQVWLRNWRCVVLFPCTTAESYLNYKFTVNVRANLFSEAGGIIMSFTSIGEEPNASPTSNIVVNTDAGWPLIADLDEASESYNGHYGFKEGSVTVNRTFKVAAGRTPAVAIVVGFVVRLTAGRLRLTFADDSHIGFTNGRVCYRYTPVPILAQT